MTPVVKNNYRDEDLTFFALTYNNYDATVECLADLRKHYPMSRVILRSDGDPDPRFPILAKRNNVDFRGELRLFGIEPEKHAARFQGGSLGVLQGTRSYILQDENGQIQLTHSVSAGLDYAAVGPEHAWLRDKNRVEYTYATDDKALEAFLKLARLEGIIPALESAHAIAEVIQRAPKMGKDKLIIVNLSGRGDKDVAQVVGKVKL